MFKEIKGIASTPNAIKNEAEIRRLIADVRARYRDRDGNMIHGYGMNRKEYQEAAERAKKAARKWDPWK